MARAYFMRNALAKAAKAEGAPHVVAGDCHGGIELGPRPEHLDALHQLCRGDRHGVGHEEHIKLDRLLQLRLANHASEFIPRSARDWAASGVLTNVVRIGVTDTRAHDAFPGRDLAKRRALVQMKRAASTAEIADYLYWLGSDANTYVTGKVTAIAGGE